jgi:hypothetical protein
MEEVNKERTIKRNTRTLVGKPPCTCTSRSSYTTNRAECANFERPIHHHGDNCVLTFTATWILSACYCAMQNSQENGSPRIRDTLTNILTNT